MTRRRPSFKQLTEMVEKFNRNYPVGTTCVLHMDSGHKVRTRVTHKAIVMGFSTAVAWFEGISGCYAIDRVRNAMSNSIRMLRDDDKWIDAIAETLKHVHMCPHEDASHIRLEDFKRLSEMLEAENLRRSKGRALVDRPSGFD